MEVVIKRDYDQMSRAAAQLVVDVLNTKPNAVLGMATGSTPLGLYQELVRLHQAGQVDFSRVTTFNLDEYVGLPANHPQSYHYFMDEHFFRHVNIPRHNINIPSGGTSLDARKLVLVASGKTKAKAIAQAVEGPVTSMVTASALQLHRDATVIVDADAAAGLTMRDYYEFIYAAKPAAPKS